MRLAAKGLRMPHEPALKQGDVVEVFGWVMLSKIEAGRYRIKRVEVHHGLLTYAFAKPNGSKVIINHYCDSVDPWLRTSRDDPDLNKIVRVVMKSQGQRLLAAGDLCPTPDCGHVLMIASPSGGYLECPSGHVHATRIRCQSSGCRRLATSFQFYVGSGHKATCADHDGWPFP